MNKLILVAAIAGLSAVTGCSSTKLDPVSVATPVVTSPVVVAKEDPPVQGGKLYKLRNYDGPEAMDTDEVIQASKQCIYVKMRPVVVYLSVRTEQGKLKVPVSVNCEPM